MEVSVAAEGYLLSQKGDMSVIVFSVYRPVSHAPASAAATAFSNSSASTPLADKAINALLKSDTLLQAVASHTARYMPASGMLNMGALWGLFATNGGTTISKSDVGQALSAVGIKDTNSVDALWAQIDPTNSSSVTAIQFGKNAYIDQAIASTAASVQAGAEAALVKGNGSVTTNTLFDYLNSSPGSVIGGVLNFMA